MIAKNNPMSGKETIVADFSHYSGMALEITGVIVIVIGAVLATYAYLRTVKGKNSDAAFSDFRANLGRGILLGLEFLVAADIIGTVAVSPTWANVGVLAVIVLIRTFLSFTLEMEIHGRFPWQAGGSTKGRG